MNYEGRHQLTNQIRFRLEVEDGKVVSAKHVQPGLQFVADQLVGDTIEQVIQQYSIVNFQPVVRENA